MENFRKHRDIELCRIEKKSYLVSEPNYHATKFFTKNLLSILELNKMLIYEFWYGYVKPKYGEKAKLCYMDIDIVLFHCIHKNR